MRVDASMFLLPSVPLLSVPLRAASTAVTVPFTAPPSHWPTLSVGARGPAVASLEMALATLGYLPVSYPGRLSHLTPLLLSKPPAASWHWHWREPGLPQPYHRLWSRNTYTVATQGAVMQFEMQEGLSMTGSMYPAAFQRLAYDLAHHIVNRAGFSYVLVQKNNPETLTLWYNGRVVLHSLTNTGIPQSPTPNGTWPVYLRYVSQDMSGMTPFGTPYNDPGVPYVNYFNGGDAVHGFVRAAYGFPQSLGCVELPIPAARVAWGYIHYGTLVTVEN